MTGHGGPGAGVGGPVTRPNAPEPPAEAALDVLLEAAPVRAGARGGRPPGPIARRYGGPLAIPLRPHRPTVIANFVESLDGIVALATGPRGGGSDISGSSEADRFVMALLRTVADVVVVGAGTVRAAPRHEWTPAGISPAWAPACEEWRASMRLAPQPTTVVVTSAGDVDPGHPGLSAPGVPVVIATTVAGARALTARGIPPGARVEVLVEEGPLTGTALRGLLSRLHVRLALCEGGPHLLADLLADDALDELFLTLAPQILGRASAFTRLGLAEGHAWEPGSAHWARLGSVRRGDSHLFLRYSLRRGSGDGHGRPPSR